MKPKIFSCSQIKLFCSIKTVFVFLLLSFTLTLDVLIKHLSTGPSGNSMFCDHEMAMFPEAHPMKTSPVEGSQHILPPMQ